jgi:hypothetical protein
MLLASWCRDKRHPLRHLVASRLHLRHIEGLHLRYTRVVCSCQKNNAGCEEKKQNRKIEATSMRNEWRGKQKSWTCRIQKPSRCLLEGIENLCETDYSSRNHLWPHFSAKVMPYKSMRARHLPDLRKSPTSACRGCRPQTFFILPFVTKSELFSPSRPM